MGALVIQSWDEMWSEEKREDQEALDVLTSEAEGKKLIMEV